MKRDETATNAPALRTDGLTRRFGGLVAVAGVSLECRDGELHAVIGPNGAGKTTLVNLLSGELAPSAGRIELYGEDVTGLPPEQLARRGVGRSYQKTNIFLAFSAFENCRLAAQARLAGLPHLLRPAERLSGVNAAAERSLAAAGLEARAQTSAAALSHGEQRQLEIAMTLATGPRLLLLDEPLAGMGAEESVRMIELIRGLRAGHAVLLVEHDMDAVFALADRLTVMVDGAVLASGLPSAIRANPEVRRAYLGEDVEAAT